MTDHGTPFLLQIVTPTGDVVRLPAGGPIELEFITKVVEQLQSRWLRLMTATQREQALREALHTTITDLKRQTRFLP